MRLFIALDIDEDIRRRIVRFVEGIEELAPDARWAKPESLHVTLKFIGEQTGPAVEQIKQLLRTVHANVAEMDFRGYGFFPTARSARVFWAGITAGPELAALAAEVDDKISVLGIPREERAFSPHLTRARGAGSSGLPRRHKGDVPNHRFQRLQQKLAALPSPEFGTMTPREFFLYRSELSPRGSKYTKLAGFGLSDSP
jgi:2'-5' RNA ligase